MSWQSFPGCPVLLAVMLFCFSSTFVGEIVTQLENFSDRTWSRFKKFFFLNNFSGVIMTAIFAECQSPEEYNNNHCHTTRTFLSGADLI
jgi:hypothetical protein